LKTIPENIIINTFKHRQNLLVGQMQVQHDV